MAKALTINYNGKAYKAGYDRAAAKMFSRMGFTPADVADKPFDAVIPFVFCAFKKYQPSINQNKVEEIYDALAAKGGCPQLLGADISAEAVRRAARQVPEGIFCAASTAHLPLAAESLDLIVNIFSPLMAEEFLRVLKPGGYLLRVVPMERHLFELKAAVYDRPYENPPAEPAVEGFRLLRTQTLRKTITLSSNEDVQALFLMTPYYYKTGAEDQQKLAAVPSLRVTTEFLIAVCQKP